MKPIVQQNRRPWNHSHRAVRNTLQIDFLQGMGRRILPGLVALGLASGCASGIKRQAKSELTIAAATRSEPLTNSVPSSRLSPHLPDLERNAALADYLTYAALNNPQLEAAFNRWKAELERVSQASTLPDPRFNYGYFVREVETRVGPQQQRIGVAQMFPWFGKLQLRGEAALKGARAAQQQYEAAKLRLFEEVKQAYYEYFYLGRAITVAQENVELLKQFEQIARAKYESGTALHGDVIKAQVELDKLRDRVRTFEDLKNPIEARLNAALNRLPDARLAWPKTVQAQPFPDDVAALIGRLKELNPELRALDFQAERDQTDIALAKKAFYPDITLNADYTVTGQARVPDVPDSGKDAVLVGFSVNIPLWWDKYRAGVREAQDRYTATRQERTDQANRLTTALKLALFKFRDAERKIALYRDALIPKANQNLQVIQRSFEAGQSDFLSLIDAERILLEFQLTYERAVADREQGWATLERLVGGALSGVPPASSSD